MSDAKPGGGEPVGRGEPSVILNKVADGKGNFGYNAQTGEFGDMVEMGILDPTKVTRYALQNAASIAGLMITSEAMVAEAPKKDAGGGGDHGHGGGMGGMAGQESPLQRSALVAAAPLAPSLGAPTKLSSTLCRMVIVRPTAPLRSRADACTRTASAASWVAVDPGDSP